MSSRNQKHYQVFDIVHKWSKEYIKNLNSMLSKCVTSFSYFSYGRDRNWKITSY